MIDIRNPQSIGKTIDPPALEARPGAGITQLADAELDHAAAAGSKPGMVGDGRTPLQLTAARRAALP